MRRAHGAHVRGDKLEYHIRRHYSVLAEMTIVLVVTIVMVMGTFHRRLFHRLLMEYARAPSRQYYPLPLTSYQFFERSNAFSALLIPRLESGDGRLSSCR